jgi:osmotically-inducible protein OsmY
MKPDSELKADVLAELQWDPAIDATQIGTAVRDGVVTLIGQVDSYAQKHAAERAVLRVAGVRGIVLELDVHLAPDGTRSDTEIAQAAVHALRWHSLVPEDRVKVKVENGQVTLEGELDWAYERESVEQCIRPLVGVRSVRNLTTIKPRADAHGIASQITAALGRHAQREARHIQVDVDGSIVTVSGHVDSLPEHNAVIGTACAAHGVSRVIDKLEVGESVAA